MSECGKIPNKRYLFDCAVCGTSGCAYNDKVYANANPALADTFIRSKQAQPGATYVHSVPTETRR